MSKRHKQGGRLTVPSAPTGTGMEKRSRRRWVIPLCSGIMVLLVALLLTWPRRQTARGPAPAAPTPALASLPAAEQSLRTTVAQIPKDADAYRALARYLLEQGRPFEALWQLRAALDLQAGEEDTALSIARALSRAGFGERALSLLGPRLGDAPTGPEARVAAAEIYLAMGRPQEARAVLQGTEALLSTAAQAQLLLGDARLALGDTAGARAAYQRATGLEPEAAVGYDRLGRLALAAGEWAAAKSDLAAAREREPGSAGIGFRLGEAYAGAGERKEAERLWTEVAAAAPGYAPARVALGKALQRRGQLDAAAVQLVAAVNAAPAVREAQFALAAVMTAQGDRASAAYQRGFYFMQTDQPHQAVTEFRRIQTIAPERVDGPVMTGLAYVTMKRLDLAAAEAERGLKRHPDNARLLGQLGLLHVLGRNRPKAKRLCEAWLRREPGAAEPYRLLGRIAREELRLSDSLKLCEQALARNPTDPVICSETARTLAALGGPENSRRALDLARQAVDLNPKEADHWLQLAGLLRGAGREEEATDAFLRALDLDPLSVASATALVQVAAREGRRETSRFYAGLVTALQDRGRTSDTLWRAVYRDPADAAVHEALARFLLASGDLRRASYQLEQLVVLRPGDAAVRRERAVVERLLALRAE
jgi:tetratricopeptide (TPR) repeat protein